MVIRIWPVVILVGLSCAVAGAQVGEVGPEVADVLDELQEAGAPATTTEIAEILAEQRAGPLQGQVLVRTGWTGDDGLDHTARVRYASSWLELKGRWRQYRDGEVQAGGGLLLGGERWRLAVGQLGLSHGFGLLVAGAGRGFSLTADGGLGARDRGLVAWAGTLTPRVVVGLGGLASYQRLKVRLLVGRRGGVSDSEPVTGLAQITVGGPRAQAAVLVLKDEVERGISVALRYKGTGAQASAEGVWRQTVGGGVPLMALLFQGAWKPHHTVQMEILAGFSESGPRPVMGQKHPVFGDWAGRGVAVRGTWRLARGLGAKILVHRGRGHEDVVAGRRRLRTLTDALFTQSWASGWGAQARWRQGGDTVATWSERFPWQPPVAARWDSRRIVSLKGSWQGEGKKGQLLWRRLSLSRFEQDLGLANGGQRSLISLSGARFVAKNLYLRLGWTMSWGDPVDLVSAVVPFRGYVLPRHWGHWRTERIVGLEAVPGRLRMQVAVSWREAEQSADQDSWAAWVEGGWRW